MPLRNTRYMQYVAALTGTLTSTSTALYTTWPSPILLKIAAGNSPLGDITNEQSSWIVSSYALGHIPGAMAAGWIVENCGRKGGLLISGILLTIPWLVVAFTTSVWLVSVSRFIGGAAASLATCAVVLYNGEIAEKEIRGKLGASYKLLAITGDLINYSIGPFVSYLALTLICGTVPLIFVVVFYFMPESPLYLLKMGKEEEARKSLKRLLKSDIKQNEFEEHVHLLTSSIEEEVIKTATLWEFLSRKEYRKSVILSLGIQTLHQLSGFQAIYSYNQSIIASSKSSISPEMSSMIGGIVQFPAAIISAILVERAGRRPLLIASSLGCAFALLLEGIYFYLDGIHTDVGNIVWIPTFGIIFYQVMRCIGIGTLTFVLMGELYPASIRGHAVGTSTLYNNVLSFIVVKNFEPISKAYGVHVMFGIFSSVCVLGALFIYFVLPETKGKTFVEIGRKVTRNVKTPSNSIDMKPITMLSVENAEKLVESDTEKKLLE